MTTTRFCFVRHGETAWNTERRLQGNLDIALNQKGHAQARAAAQFLAKYATDSPIHAVYSSDLQRAWHTAETIASALALSAQALPAVRERRYGLFEGLTYDEANSKYPELYAQLEQRDPDFVIPQNGESLRQFQARVSTALEELADRHVGQRIVVVLHGGVLDIINRYVRGNPLHTPRDFLIPNTGLNWLRREQGANPAWQIEHWGDTQHLDDLALDELA